jgi:hypothetical protein
LGGPAQCILAASCFLANSLVLAAKLDLNHLSLPTTAAAPAQRDDSVVNDKPGAGSQQTPRVAQTETTTAFDQLVLPPGHKDMVLSLIAQHFRDKESKEKQQFDIVAGKGRFSSASQGKCNGTNPHLTGKGLIILLHGAPGVGKTTTAGKSQLFAQTVRVPSLC